MAKYIYNCSGETKTYHGIEIADGEFLQISATMDSEYATNTQLIADLALAVVKMSSNGSSALSGNGSAHVDFLKNTTPPTVKSTNFPFTDKILPNGKKLFARVHGVSASVSSTPYNIDFVVPYAACKLTGIELIGGNIGDTCNFKILDTATGTISGVANYTLNQFGFNVNVGKDFYKRESSYDADLIQNMKIRIEYNSIVELPVNVYINYVLHQVVD